MTEPAHLEYARDVLAGRVVSGRLLKLAAERSLSDHANPPAPWRYYQEGADPRVRFIEAMPLTQGTQWIGKMLKLQPWQLWTECEIWGWRHESDPHRMRFRQSILEVAKGGGKTPIAAAESLYAVAYGDPGCNVVSFATREKQAKLIFNAAKRMYQSPRFPKFLKPHFEVTKTSITGRLTGTVLEAMPSSTDRSLDGYVISFLVFDEAASLIHRERAMDILSAARKLPSSHTRWITTAQAGARDRLYHERRQHCIDVLEGRATDDRIFAAIYNVDREDEKETNWLNPACWPKANPNIDVSQDRDMLTEALNEALHTPSTKADNLAKHLNIYAGSTVSWIETAEWSACRQDKPGEPEIGAPVCPVEWLDTLARAGISGSLSIGIDLAENRDLTAVTNALAADDGRTYLHFRCFAPRPALDRLPRDVREVWERATAEDILMIDPGPITDFDGIEDYIRMIARAAGSALSGVAADRKNATDLINNLEQDGIPIMAVGQTTAVLNAPTKHAERLIAKRRIRHDGNPFIEWQIGNCQLYSSTNNNVRLVKPSSQSVYKIDAVAALINAIAALADDSEPESGFAFRAAHF